jgi:RNA polymerase sigma-70 factor (ECF subfamily)
VNHEPPDELDRARRRRLAGWIDEIAAGGRAREAAVKKLFEACEGRVTGWLRWHFGVSPAEAEDLWQETVITVCRVAHERRADADAQVWLFTIVKSKAIDLLRRASRRYEVGSEEGSESVDAAVAPARSDTDDCVRRGFLRFWADQPEDAAWIAMADVEEHTIPDVAAKLGRAETATRTYLCKLRKRLKPYLEPCLDGRAP